MTELPMNPFAWPFRSQFLFGAVVPAECGDKAAQRLWWIAFRDIVQDVFGAVALTKTDRADARIAEVVDECYELFLDLDADEHQIEFPIVYASAKAGLASLTRPANGTMPDGTDLRPLMTTIMNTIPALVGHASAVALLVKRGGWMEHRHDQAPV